MKKDVVYIDVDDDITTIVGKIKSSTEKIIGLVPPSRVGVLQSTVSMRLLARTAEKEGKRIVLITNNQSLISLAAAAQIPVARNLQSKPELAEVPVLKVDGDDIIDGGTLPVGDFAKDTDTKPGDDAVDKVIKAGSAATAAAGATPARAAKKAKPPGGKKVPDFSSFRKKLFIIIGAALALIVFLVWAIWFAPRATVVITARTTTVTVDRNVTLLAQGSGSVEDGTIRAVQQEQTSDVSVEFTPTGERNAGEKATGTVRFSTNSISNLGTTIPANTSLRSSSGNVYRTDESVTFTLNNFSGVDVGVTADEPGRSYNGATGSVSGAPSGVSASLRSATSGGTDRMVTVVTADDVRQATERLNEQQDASLRERVADAFGESSVVIEESYSESRSNPTPSVAVDAEASGQVRLTATITATMRAIEKTDLEQFIRASIEREIEGIESQRIYETGADDVSFAQFAEQNDTVTVRLTANGTVGPTIEESEVKDQARGKRYGDIQTSLEAINGVDDVDTRFWPFWVRTIPNNDDRITVEFELQDAN